MRNVPGSVLLILSVLVLANCASAPVHPEARWWKGNLHTHSLWSDGADFPEMIAAWYRDHGYNFLAVTEHDMLQQGSERWVDMSQPDAGWPPRNASARAALPEYLERFGEPWVQHRQQAGQHLVRLRGLSEYRHLFERPDSFLFIMAEEITDKGGAHVNAFNLDVAILPRGGATTAQRTTNNLAAVAEQRRASNRPVSAIINHPNYVWSLKAEEIAQMRDARLFEVYNGHLLTNSAGDSVHPSTDQMWDVVLTLRHRAGLGPVYGVATDDAHEYRSFSDTISMPGRGWVMVRAAGLQVDRLLAALEAGEFYASTGVTLTDLRRDGHGISITIAAEPGVSYRTQFIGTRHPDGTIGEVFAEVDGPVANYIFRGHERYVRAQVISSEPHIDPISGKRLGRQAAWVQPVMRAVAAEQTR
ncbi:MAG TPA: hypothetical protein VFO52_13500 [Longimicrobiales bacterium]|nr:hypothetical protein [Longimicrobiales bacterium]